MRQYRGIQTEHGYAVLVEDGAESGGLAPKFSLRQHSPSGFAWGYAGSGPAQLALAICADALANDDRALAANQTFKNRVVAHLRRAAGCCPSGRCSSTWPPSSGSGRRSSTTPG